MDIVTGDYTCSLWLYGYCCWRLYLQSVAVYIPGIFGRLYLQSVAEDVLSSKYSHIDHGMMLYSYVVILTCESCSCEESQRINMKCSNNRICYKGLRYVVTYKESLGACFF